MDSTITISLVTIIIVSITLIIKLILYRKSSKKSISKLEESVIISIETPIDDIQLSAEEIEIITHPDTEIISKPTETTPNIVTVRYIRTSGKDEFYKDKLSDQLWKNKSAEIKKKHEYRCQECGSQGDQIVELNSIDDLYLYVDFDEVYDKVKSIFVEKDLYIERFQNNSLSSIELSDYNKSVQQLDNNVYFNSFEKIDMLSNKYNNAFFTQFPYNNNEIHKSDIEIKCNLPYYAKDKIKKETGKIIIEFIQEGFSNNNNNNNNIYLRHTYDYKTGLDFFRGQGILTQNGFSIIFPLYNIDKPATLNVHHKAYYEDLEPWECPEKELITLCRRCHIKAHENEIPVKRIVNN